MHISEKTPGYLFSIIFLIIICLIAILNSIEKDLTLSMRVRRPLTDCEIVISQNGEVIKRKKMKKAIPAEMIQIKIAKELLSECGDMEVSVR